MDTTQYKCPLCQKTMSRDLVLFLNHTDQHIIDQIKANNPNWVESDGACEPCAEFYKKQMSGDMRGANIGPNERKKRVVMGVVMLCVAGMLGYLLSSRSTQDAARLWIFVPLFLSLLGFLQAKSKTCVVLAELRTQNPDTGSNPISDEKMAVALQKRGRIVLLQALLGAALIAGGFYFLA